MTDRKHKHLLFPERLTIERMIKRGFSKQDIATATGHSLSTIYNEIKRGSYEHLNSDYTTEIRYSAELAQLRYEGNKKNSRRQSKILSDENLKTYIRTMVVDYKYSPEAILLQIKSDNLEFDVEIRSVNTIYTAIKNGHISGVTLEYLPRKEQNKRRKKRVCTRDKEAYKPAGTSIELRSESVLTRQFFGDWEMDCVLGKVTNHKTLLVLTERKTRFEIIEVLKRHTAKEVIRALNRIEKRFGSAFYKIFKSITVDNGAEFKNCKGMEKALYRKGKRTVIYYCHPYSSFERGTNENNNHMIRRFFKKGENFDLTVNRNKVKEVEEWMNFYPRPLFNGGCSYDLFMDELERLNCTVAM